MNIDQVKQSFAGVARSHGIERHSVRSLSKRLMVPRASVRKLLNAGQLEFQQQFSAGRNGRTYEFSSARLDATREQIVNQIINDIRARLEGLDLTDEETAIAAHTGLREQKANVELEFSKPNDPDDEDDGSDVSKLVGGGIGAAEGAVIGSGLGGGSLGSLVGGTVAGGAIGEQAGGGNKLAQVAAAGGLGYIAHKAILQNGGYAEVARKTGIAGADLWNAVKGMLTTTAEV